MPANPGPQEQEFDKALNAVIDSCGRATDHYDVARVVAEYNKVEGVLMVAYTNETWYSFNKETHGWEVSKCDKFIRIQLSAEIAPLFKARSDFYWNKAIESEDGKKDALQAKAGVLTEIVHSLKNNSFKSCIIREAQAIMEDDGMVERLDSLNYLMRFPNGVYDFKSHIFRDGRPSDYCSLSARHSYVPFIEDMAHLGHVKKYMTQVFQDPDLREYAVRVLASMLDASFHLERFYIFTGSGSNSKSILCKVFHHILGDYGCILPVACLTQKRVASNAAQSEIERTKGRRFALLQEPGNDETINIGLMKELSGGDMIQARGLFREPIEFRPQFTMVLTCNELPYVPSDDGGTWRRIRAVPFLSKFVEKPRKANEFPLDCEIEDNLKDVWGPTLLSYLVHMCETMPRDAANKRFIPEPQIVLQQTNKYKMDNDPIAQYIDERIIVVERRKVELKIATVFSDFRQWAMQNRATKTQQSRQVFEKKLKDKLKEMGADFFSIAIKEDEVEDESDDEDVPIEVKIERWFKDNFQPVQGGDYIPIPTKTIAQFFIDNVMSDGDKRGLESTKIAQDVQKGISAIANKTGMVVKTDMVKVGEKRTSIRRLHNVACAIEALKHM